MKSIKRLFTLLFMLKGLFLYGATVSLQTLYQSLDPYSFTQQMAFYELYRDTPEGKQAFAQACHLVRAQTPSNKIPSLLLPHLDIQPIISLVTRQPFEAPIQLEDTQLHLIDTLCASFPSKKSKGSQVWTKKEVLSLPSEEIDLSRALLIDQFEQDLNKKEAICQYEAVLDIMALQILTRLPEKATPQEKIKEINRYIFYEMQFRFPPHSLYAKDIDLYTLLPSVLDSRQGVCLGVSLLYLSLAQRLGLSLEIITPPGHIYLRYKDENTTINIETTARGIHIPSEQYLSLNTHKLQERTIKEAIGLALLNHASLYWQQELYEKSIALYEKARPYLPKDRLLDLFLGLNYLFVGRIKEGEKLLCLLKDFQFPYNIGKENLATDYFNKATDIEGIKLLFLPVTDERESIVEKQKKIQAHLASYPHFRAGLFQLAITHLQLGHYSQAKEVLLKYHALDPEDPTVEYYLAVIFDQQLDHEQAWHHLKQAEALTQKEHHDPIALKALRQKLQMACPKLT